MTPTTQLEWTPGSRHTAPSPSPGGSSLTLPTRWACPVPHSLFFKFLHCSKIHIKVSIVTLVQCTVQQCYIYYIYVKTGPQSSSSQAAEAVPTAPPPHCPMTTFSCPVSPTTPGTSGKWVTQVSSGGATLHVFTHGSLLHLNSPCFPRLLLIH